MGKVILCGGLPMLGKSTSAAIAASRIGGRHISTDDIGEAVCAFCAIDRMRGMGHPDYYEKVAPEDQLDDLLRFRESLSPSIKRLWEIHSSWGCSAVIEGYMISPAALPDEADAVFLTADDGLLRSRLDASPAFRGASEAAKANYLARSVLFRAVIEDECLRAGARLIRLDGTETPDAVADMICGD